MLKQFAASFRARWADMDFNGHMKNTGFLDYIADSRMLFFKENGFQSSRFKKLQIGLVAFSDTINYFKALFMYDHFSVRLLLKRINQNGSQFTLLNEIHSSLEGEEETAGPSSRVKTFGAVMVQIALIDIVFSLDSVITAVGMASHIEIMIGAVLISVGIMMISAKAIGTFVEANPAIKILALSFLIMVGVALIGDGFDFHIPRGYIYFSMAFSISVEILNMKMRKNRQRIALNKKIP